MFNNKYAHINDLALLKKPRKRIIPQGPDLSHFITGNAELKKCANFALEMMKFLPKFEQLTYAGKMQGTEVTFTHGGKKTQVSQEWWDAFNEFSITDDELNGYGLSGLTDSNGDHRISNADTIPWYESSHPGEDGLTQWRTSWVFGQHHRVDRFGPFGSEDGSGFAGGGMGARFKNIDFVAEASEWNHIMTRGGNPDGQGLALADQSYFLTPSDYSNFNFLGAIGKTWDDVKNLLETKFAGQSYYQIVMSKSYQALTAEEATLLIAAMYESRERAWAAMTEAFGPVNLTRNDKEMIEYINNHSLLTKVNTYTNSHALALFPLFFYMQHSFQNQVTMFYEKNEGDGYVLSALDKRRFWEFAEWARSEVQKYRDQFKLTDEEEKALNGNDQKAKIAAEKKKNAYEAVQRLYDEWFGAVEAKSGKPVYAGYKDQVRIGDEVKDVDWKNTSSDHGEWVVGFDLYLPNQKHVTQIWRPYVTYASYGWDRKWSDDPIMTGKFFQDWHHASANDVKSWTALHNALYGSESYINPIFPGEHPNYAAAQFYGLSYIGVVSGPVFASNWVVHAIGMYLKNGEGKDILKVMERCSQKRVAAAEFKQDMKDYLTRKEELEYEKAEDEKAALKALERTRAQRKETEKRGQGSGTRVVDGSTNKKDMERALQKLRQRLLTASSKHKAWLKKIRENNQ